MTTVHYLVNLIRFASLGKAEYRSVRHFLTNPDEMGDINGGVAAYTYSGL